MASSAIKTPAFQAKAGNIQNEDGSSIYSNGDWSLKNSTAVASVTIKDNGKVGVGTASPSAALDVTSSDTLVSEFNGTNASNTAEIIVRSNGGVGNNTRARIIAGYEAGGANYGGFLAFNTTSTSNVNTERMRIHANGRIMVGGTTTTNTNPGLYVYSADLSHYIVDGPGGTNRGIGWRTQNTNRWNMYMTGTEAGSNTGSDLYFARYSDAGGYLSTALGLRRSDGSALFPSAGGTASAANAVLIVGDSNRLMRSTSALKYKEDITPISYGLDTVLSMKPIEYKSKCEADKDAEHKFIGFIADWEEANLPALVQKDGEGQVDGFSYDRLTAVLCKAIQEQQAMIEELKAKVSALESK